MDAGNPTTARTIRVAVVGCGYWGPNLVRAFTELPEAEVAWVYDRDMGRARAVARQFPGIRVAAGLEQVLQDSGVDAVAVATPAHTHAALAEAILRAGKHTFVEKPLALSSADCRKLIELARSRQRILMVGHTFLFNDAVIRLQEIIARGELGEVWYLHARRLNLGQIRQDVNALWNLAPHDISIMLFLLGEFPEQVVARGYDFLGQGMEDLVTLTLEFGSGKVGIIEVSWLSPNKVRDLTVVGSRKMALYNDVSTDARLVLYDRGVDNVPPELTNFGEFQFRLRFGDVHIPHLPMREPLRVEVQHFVECVRTGKRPLTDGENGLRVVEVLEAAQQSLAENGATISLVRSVGLAA